MRKKTKVIIVLIFVLLATVGVINMVDGQYEPDSLIDSAFTSYNQAELEREAERERIQKLDAYSLDNVVDAAKMKAPNGNKMNVILMIPDGQNVSEQTLARWYQGYRLGTDEYICGMVRTYCADSAITDSAAAATAYATGYKTNEGFEGMLPRKSDMPGAIPVNEYNNEMPFATILEAAKLAGKSTGLVVTAPIMHATPAAFSSHVNDRASYNKIAKQQINQGIDVMLGGGGYYLKDGRDDGRDLIDDAIKSGYSYITRKSQLEAAQGNKLLGIFAPYDMNYDFDRTTDEPSLEEMTKKAIEVLDKNTNGFFLLVEGSKIDYASHAHDPVGVVSESLSFDKAFRAAVEFAKKDGNTIVISCADHGNGGMAIGVGQSGYAQMNIDSYIGPLKKAKYTGAGVYQRLSQDKSDVVEKVAKYYGITDLTNDEIKSIKSTTEVMAALGAIMSKRTNIGWISGGHTGEEIPLAVYAPEKYSLKGIVDNTDVSHFIQSALGISTNDITGKLFIPIREAFAGTGAEIKLETISASREVVVVEKGEVTMRLPIDTSIALFDDAVCRLSGVTVLSNGKTYVSADVVELFNNVLGSK